MIGFRAKPKRPTTTRWRPPTWRRRNQTKSPPANAGRFTTPTVARYDLDARPFGEPCRDRASIPVRQDVDDAVPLEITDDRPVAVALLPRPVIDADHPRRHGLAAVASARNSFTSGLVA